MKKIGLISIIILVIINLPLFDFFLQEAYTYSNHDETFLYSEEGGKGLSYSSCLLTYGQFLCKHPEKDQGDNQLYRTFTLKPWRFWEWRQFIFHSERFMLPYKEPVLHDTDNGRL